MQKRDWLLWSTGKRSKVLTLLAFECGYVSDWGGPGSPGGQFSLREGTPYATCNRAARDALDRLGMSVQMTEYIDTRPMASFKFRILQTGRRQTQSVVVLPPLDRFFDLRAEPAVEPSSLQVGRWMWIQPEVFDRTGVIFQGGSTPADGLYSIDVRDPAVRELSHLLVTLDEYLERR